MQILQIKFKIQIRAKRIQNFIRPIAYLLICLFAHLLICFFPSKASAQTISVGVYPPIIQLQVNPPATVRSPITLQNLSDQPLNMQILMQPFTASSDENGSISLLEKKIVHTQIQDFLTTNVQLQNAQKQPIKEVLLTPRAVMTLYLFVTVPKDQKPNDYYFSVIFTTDASDNPNANASSVGGGIATNVLVSIGPHQNPQGFINTFSAPGLVEHGPIPFSVKLTNQSNFFIQPQGFILITNMFGQTVGKVNLLPVNVLARSSRYIPDDNHESLTQAVWPETFLIGPYSATLTIALSDKGPQFERTIHFLATPWQLCIGFIFAIFFGVIVWLKVKERLKKENI